NLYQLNLGVQNYVGEWSCFPPIYQGATCRWTDSLAPYVAKDSKAWRCPDDVLTTPLSYDPAMVLSFGMNTFNFAGKKYCFWYGVHERNVRVPEKTILMADCNHGAYYVGSGSVFKDPVAYVDYRHQGWRFSAAFCDGHVEKRMTTSQEDWDASK
ncbi:MAG TPA: hypothetical protein PKZ08_15405, partial [Vicinamibacterales bacterium]|nr:hypothetical protein [Vicinamibacterales bacterium]